MPAVSKAQFRMMMAATKDSALRKKLGMSKAQLAEWTGATKNVKSLPEHVKKSK